ncbi:hypothetical protein ANN_07140 [Periplaneta americana]|uniref:Uncharacterized protein n=1 Tax=Periplaneta americana TaxID=6978 RepID=A0ABQ8TI29_PERAM|nr:hypothetical protein ANN_07140 [Periplaneta americana]
MAGLCEGGNEPSGSLKATCNDYNNAEYRLWSMMENTTQARGRDPFNAESVTDRCDGCWTSATHGFLESPSLLAPLTWRVDEQFLRRE